MGPWTVTLRKGSARISFPLPSAYVLESLSARLKLCPNIPACLTKTSWTASAAPASNWAMSFTFQWPRFSEQFHTDAIQMLNNALNKGDKPPVIADKIEVVELEMGTQVCLSVVFPAHAIYRLCSLPSSRFGISVNSPPINFAEYSD